MVASVIGVIFILFVYFFVYFFHFRVGFNPNLHFGDLIVRFVHQLRFLAAFAESCGK